MINDFINFKLLDAEREARGMPDCSGKHFDGNGGHGMHLVDPSPADISQARIAELLQALTSGPIGDAILGLVRGEKRLMIRPYESLEPNTFVVTIEDKLEAPAPPIGSGFAVGTMVIYRSAFGTDIDAEVVEIDRSGDMHLRLSNGSVMYVAAKGVRHAGLRSVPYPARDPLHVGARAKYGSMDCVIEHIANGVIRVRPAGGSPFNTTLDKLDPA